MSRRRALQGLARTIHLFRPYVRAQRLPILLGSTALLVEVGLRLLEPWPLKVVVDHVIAHQRGGGSTMLLALAALATLAVAGGRALAAYVSTVSFALAGNRVLTHVRGNAYRHLQRLSLAFHAKSRRGDLLSRLTGDVGRLQEVTVTAAMPLLANIVGLVGMLAVMLWLNWQLGLISLMAFPLFLFTTLRRSRRIRGVAREQRRREGDLASVAAESLGAIEVVHAYQLEDTFEQAFVGRSAESLRQGVRAKRLAAGLERRTDLLVGVATALVLYFGARSVLEGSLTPGELIVFVMYLKNAFKPLRDMAKYTGRLASAAASGERIVDLLETPVELTEREDAQDAPRLRGEVRLERVTLEYEPGCRVLSDVTLHVDAGETVALVGASGSGKSSIAGLLLRFYDATDGRVLIDGIDVRDMTLRSLRRQVGIVLQDSVLFQTSIRENIAYGAPGASDEEVEAAARLANAHDFISALPRGYETVVGERGVTLSGGERQRVAIARAALRDAPIIVLDEPTAGLDRVNERLVIEALRRLAQGSTTFHIAHDLSTVRDADRIVVVEGGRIVEIGRHDDLVRRGGAYAAMYGRESAHVDGRGRARQREPLQRAFGR